MKKFIIVFYLSIFAHAKQINAQKNNKYSFGLNVIHFSDWKSKPLSFFNPEISFSQKTSTNSFIYYSLNAFFNKSDATDNQKIGNIAKRLIFAVETGLRKNYKTVSCIGGLTVRYRNEQKIKYFYPQIDPFEFVFESKRSHFDPGVFASIKYNLATLKNFTIQANASYKYYIKGVKPISFGLNAEF
jgi:hypothetical protein